MEYNTVNLSAHKPKLKPTYGHITSLTKQL